MAGDDDILDSPDGLNEAERAEFAQMQEATTGAVGLPDPGAGAADTGADAAGAADGASKVAAVDPGAASGADGAAAAAAAAAGGKDGAVAGADDAAAGADDDDELEPPELGADGKPALAADGKPRPRRKVRVSLNKFNAEKERGDKLDGELRTTRETMARVDERMRLINEALMTPKVGADGKPGEEEEQEPDPEQDAFGWMKWGRTKIASLEKAIGDIREGKQTEDGQRVVADAYMQDATQYAANEPNFVPAYNHLMNSRKQELAMYFFGIDLSEQGAAQKVTRQQWHKISSVAEEEERGIVENAIAQGRSPAQAVYQMSRYRGFVPQTEEQFAAAAEARRVAANGGAAPGANGAAKPGNGAAPAKNGAAAENGGKGGSVADEIERIKAGSEAALSLSDGGASPANPLTAQRLADMPQADFEALMDKLDGTDPDAFRRLVEGTP